MNSLAAKGSPKHGRFCGTCGLEPRHGTTQQVGRRVSFAALLWSCLVCRCHLTCQPSFSRTFRFAKRQAWWAMKWHGFIAVMYDFRSCRRGMAVLQKFSMLNDGTLKMPIVVDDPTHDSNAFPPICWIHHEGSTNKIRMPNKIGNLVLVSDIILQQKFFSVLIWAMGYKAWCCIALSALTLLFETLNPSFSLKGLLPQKSSGAKNAGKLVALQRLLGMIGGKNMVFWAKKKSSKKLKTKYRGWHGGEEFDIQFISLYVCCWEFLSTACWVWNCDFFAMWKYQGTFIATHN